MEGNLYFHIDWASLIVVSIQLTIFALLYFVFEGNFSSLVPGWLIIWRVI